MLIGDTRVQFARPVIIEIEGSEESVIHIVISFFDHWMLNILSEAIDLGQESECVFGCCNYADDIYLEVTQARNVFEPRPSHGELSINTSSVKKLGTFLDHVKSEIVRWFEFL